MKKDKKTKQKLPYGYCKQIAEIVGSDQYYVSKVLNSPDTYKGKQAEKIKQAAQMIDSNNEKIKASLTAAQSQNKTI